MNFGAVKLTLMLVVALGALAIIGLDIAILAGAIKTAMTAVVWVSLFAAALVCAATLVIILRSGYRFESDHIALLLGFFKDKVPYDGISELKQNGDNGAYFIVSGDMQSGTSVRVEILPSENDRFVAELRKHLPNLTIEIFMLPKKDKKK